jgi:mannosyltransferase
MTEVHRSAWLPRTEWLQPWSQDEHRAPGWTFLLAMTLLAAVLRLYRLGDQPFWLDEIQTWRMIRPEAGLRFWEQMREGIQGPLYLAVLWPLARVGGNLEFLLRLPAAIAGVITVPILGLAIGRLWNRRSGQLAALLLALSPFHVWYSQEARGYAFVILFTVAASLLFLRMAERGPTPGGVLVMILLWACAIWSSLSALFLWAAEALTWLIWVRGESRRDRLLWLLAFGGALVPAIPWILQATGVVAVDRLLPGAETGAALRGETTFTPLAYGYTFFSLLYGFSLGPSLREMHQLDRLQILLHEWPVLAPAAIVAICALVAGLLALRRREYLLLWLLVPVAAVTLLAWRNVKTFNPRYVAVILPWMLGLAAAGIARLERRRGAFLGGALILLFLISLSGYYHSERYAKEDLRGAAALVTARAAPGEIVFLPVGLPPFLYYYDGAAPVRANWDFIARRTRSELTAFLTEYLAGADSGWVVIARNWKVDPGGLLPEVLAAETQILSDDELTGVRILHWRRRAGEP